MINLKKSHECYHQNDETLKSTNVKNLRWALDKARRTPIKSITAMQHNGVCFNAYLTVYFTDNTSFHCSFEDYSVLCAWLKARRSWRGVMVFYGMFNQIHRKAILGA